MVRKSLDVGVLLGLIAALIAGCGDDDAGFFLPDAGSPDAAIGDASPGDGGETDASGTTDAGDASVATCDPSCGVNATCDDSSSPAACLCSPGYSGDGFTCINVDECTDGTAGCNANASCTDTDGSFTCACNPGYAGDGFTCTDADECTSGTHTCDANASCTNTDGSFTCACNPGYTGDGLTCTNVDECTDGTAGCDANNASCTDTDGSFTCMCNPGYTGDGFTCTDADECTDGTHTCDPEATCINIPGGFRCDCGPGHLNVGESCVPVSRWGLTELDGTIAPDSYGTSDGTLFGDAAFVRDTDFDGQVLALDGDGDYVQVPSSPSINPELITVSAWIWIDPTAPSDYFQIFTKDAIGARSWQFRVDNVGRIEFIVFEKTGGAVGIAKGGMIVPGTWHHVAGTWDGATIQTFIDGSLVGSTDFAGTLQSAANNAFIGRGERLDPSYFHGRIADVRLYGRALSAAEVSFLASAPHLVSQWISADTETNIVVDQVGSHDGMTAGGLVNGNDPTFGDFLVFDGTDDEVRIPNHAGLNPHHVTLSLWVRAARDDANFRQLFSKDQTAGGTNRVWQFRLNAGAGIPVFTPFDTNGATKTVGGTTGVADATWHHVAATWNGLQTRMYVDGVLDGTRSALETLRQGQINDLFIGRSQNGTPGHYSGELYDVRLYDRGLSPTEIATLAGLAP